MDNEKLEKLETQVRQLKGMFVALVNECTTLNNVTSNIGSAIQRADVLIEDLKRDENATG